MTLFSRGAAALILIVLCALLVAPMSAQDAAVDLDGIKTYLLEKTDALQAASAELVEAAEAYYALAEAADFDYEALWQNSATEVSDALLAAKEAWLAASPLYEQMEGIVAGVPVLSEYDVVLDAGVSGEEDPVDGVQFDLNLPDGRVLERPGNLFGLLEATLWGTRPDFTAGVDADLNANGEAEFGETLPDAAMLLASATTMDEYVTQLAEDAAAWEPNETDAFTALVVMVPTMSEYFGSWKESRFVAGEDATRTDFAVISRLSDIQDILSGLDVVYANVSPLVADVDAAQDEQIAQGLTDLQEYVGTLYEQEQEGRQFTAEEADVFGTEAQNRAQTIVGQISQAAALLDIELPE